VTAGFAAAYRLGADFPFQGDEECQRLFRLYLAASHGVRMVSISYITGGLLLMAFRSVKRIVPDFSRDLFVFGGLSNGRVYPSGG